MEGCPPHSWRGGGPTHPPPALTSRPGPHPSRSGGDGGAVGHQPPGLLQKNGTRKFWCLSLAGSLTSTFTQNTPGGFGFGLPMRLFLTGMHVCACVVLCEHTCTCVLCAAHTRPPTHKRTHPSACGAVCIQSPSQLEGSDPSVDGRKIATVSTTLSILIWEVDAEDEPQEIEVSQHEDQGFFEVSQVGGWMGAPTPPPPGPKKPLTRISCTVWRGWRTAGIWSAGEVPDSRPSFGRRTHHFTVTTFVCSRRVFP